MTDILLDYQLREWAEKGGIIPYDPAYVNPASIDLCLGGNWIDMYNYHKGVGPVKIRVYNPVYEWFFAILNKLGAKRRHKPSAILATTVEEVNLLDCYAAEIKLKTSPCRLGLGHPIADWVDPGFHGQLTLMLHSFKDIILVPGQRICQLVVYNVGYPSQPYGKVGHYQNQKGPTVAWEGYRDDSKKGCGHMGTG